MRLWLKWAVGAVVMVLEHTEENKDVLEEEAIIGLDTQSSDKHDKQNHHSRQEAPPCILLVVQPFKKLLLRRLFDFLSDI